MKDHITRYAEVFRNIESAAIKEGFPKTAKLAGDTAKQFEDYKANQQPYQYKPRPPK
jgi:hypothetical protein